MPAIALVTCIVLILASAGAALEAVHQNVAGIATPGDPESLASSAYTNAAAAHVVLTNTGTVTRYACFRGVVTPLAGKHPPVKSVTVCSGDLKPHTTVALEAPYDPGAVEKICDGPPNSFGARMIDWDLCTFELEPQPAH